MRTKPKSEQPPEHRCRDCAHATDRQSPSVDGVMILCRCRFDEKSAYGKWCKFLSDAACSHFLKLSNPTDA